MDSMERDKYSPDSMERDKYSPPCWNCNQQNFIQNVKRSRSPYVNSPENAPEEQTGLSY